MTICHVEARKLRPTRISTRSIWRIPAAALIAIGKKHDTTPIAIFEPEPTPNHMIITGKKMILASGRGSRAAPRTRATGSGWRRAGCPIASPQTPPISERDADLAARVTPRLA